MRILLKAKCRNIPAKSSICRDIFLQKNSPHPGVRAANISRSRNGRSKSFFKITGREWMKSSGFPVDRGAALGIRTTNTSPVPSAAPSAVSLGVREKSSSPVPSAAPLSTGKPKLFIRFRPVMPKNLFGLPLPFRLRFICSSHLRVRAVFLQKNTPANSAICRDIPAFRFPW